MKDEIKRSIDTFLVYYQGAETSIQLKSYVIKSKSLSMKNSCNTTQLYSHDKKGTIEKV